MISIMNINKKVLNVIYKVLAVMLALILWEIAALKIDSCPIEGFNREKVESYLAEKGVLDRQHWGLAVMVSFGYRDEPIKPKSRQAISDIYRTIK